MEDEINRLDEKIKKSSLVAKDGFDYAKIANAGEKFLKMTWKEGEDDLTISYNLHDMTLFSEIIREDSIFVLNALISVSFLEEERKKYTFSIEPSNLYFSSVGRVYVKKRDLCEMGMIKQTDEFLEDYKALCACILAGHNKYQDYREGGFLLYEKDSRTNSFLGMDTTMELVEYLTNLRDKNKRTQKEKYIRVKKTHYLILKITAFAMFLIAVVTGYRASYMYFVGLPYYEAVISADNAYIENNMAAVVTALKPIEVDRLEKYQKYILARAYLQSENLTNEQKENIARRITLLSSEKELTYWISIGRGDVKAAENLAMQVSDDELLLYAYLKEKEQVEADKELDGAEKSARLSALQSQIDTLAKKYKDDTGLPTTQVQY